VQGLTAYGELDLPHVRSQGAHLLDHGFTRGMLHGARSSGVLDGFIVGTVIGKHAGISIAVARAE
jgi:hypothetical protein